MRGGRVSQSPPLVRGESQPEPLRGLVLDPARLHVFPGLRPGGGIQELISKPLLGEGVGLEEGAPRILLLRRPRPHLPDRYSGLSRHVLDRLHKVQAHALLDELEDVAAGAASEAVIDALGGIDRE
jgi:hypothetical protein